MDFDPYESHWRNNVSPMTLLETCWELRSPRSCLLTCGVFRTIAGLELRCGSGEHDLIRSQYAIEIATARALAGGLESGSSTERLSRSKRSEGGSGRYARAVQQEKHEATSRG